jgi:catechol 2,3-dioxygenase-like lactoylglutathione lyase family enzyme
MPQHQGFGHLTLTVTDLERSAEVYTRVLRSQTADGIPAEFLPTAQG